MQLSVFSVGSCKIGLQVVARLDSPDFAPYAMPESWPPPMLLTPQSLPLAFEYQAFLSPHACLGCNFRHRSAYRK